MDPNETLRIIRELIQEQKDNEYIWELAEHVNALDGWLSRGGWLPEAWASDSEDTP